jgi:hypothetical protein
MRIATRPWVRALALVVLANGVFLLLALWVAHLPRERLDQRIRDAFGSGELIENDWPWLESRRGFNQYHDCSVLQMISNRDDDLWANAVAPLIYNRNKGETDRCATLRTLVTEGPNTAQYLVYRYTRYWHGYNPVGAALLWVVDLGCVRTILKVTLYCALLLLIVAAGTRHRGLLAVAASIAVTGVLFWAVPYFGQSLTHGPGDIVVILGLACLLFWRERLSRPATLVPFCAVYGAGVGLPGIPDRLTTDRRRAAVSERLLDCEAAAGARERAGAGVAFRLRGPVGLCARRGSDGRHQADPGRGDRRPACPDILPRIPAPLRQPVARGEPAAFRRDLVFAR